ncbi:hypothetical protein [Halorientalis regularis]|uniref:Dolichyl-phosphate-mannose-protein mannosyltransferase n=1 Tax=Halorientalis regularis TaxID=660518 RepID=A0A1G7T548_9EURY|nr:hypothetical protein [Halorientalis regularis]SDG29759.1 hypothetical protein SAMN05216218_12227 [Halorientalis regularis]
MDRSSKFGLSLTALVLGFAALYTHATSSLYPGLYVGIAAVTVVLVLTALVSDRRTSTSLVAGIVSVSVFFRLYTFLFPASMIGMDPDRKAISVQRVIETGHTDMIVRYFYQDISLFNVYAAEFGLLAGFDGPMSLLVYAFVLGILLPLTAVTLARHVPNMESGNLVIIAALVSTIETFGVVEGFWIHNQSLGIALWCGVLVCLGVSVRNNRALVVLTSILLVTMAFSHKIPLFMVLSVCSGAVVYGFLYRWDIGSNGGVLSNSSQTVLWSGVLSGILLFVQWSFLTGYFERLVGKVVALFAIPSGIGQASDLTPAAAVEPLPPLLDIGLWRFHGFALLLIAGLAWFGYHLSNWPFQREARLNETVILIMSAAVILAIGAIAGVLKPDIVPAGRIFSYSGPVFGVLIALSFAPWYRDGFWKYSKLLVICLLLVSQIFSLMVMIDHPDRPRMYLTGGEVEAKEFNHEFTEGDIHTDFYYAKETVPSRIVDIGRGRQVGKITTPYQPLQLELLNANLTTSAYEYVSYRTQAAVQRTQYGKFELRWDPERQLDAEMSRTYDNGAVVTYSG